MTVTLYARFDLPVASPWLCGMGNQTSKALML
jgi:hypothetical protein